MPSVPYRIVLDFDDCIFDTARLKEIMNDCDIAPADRDERVFDRIRATAGYEDFDARELVFADAKDILKTYADRITVVTTSTSMTVALEDQDTVAAETFQKLKVQESGIEEDFNLTDIRYVPGEKLSTLTDIADTYEQTVFVDDREQHVRHGVEAGITTFWLRRGATGPRYAIEAYSESIEGAKTISSLTELRRELDALESAK